MSVKSGAFVPGPRIFPMCAFPYVLATEDNIKDGIKLAQYAVGIKQKLQKLVHNFARWGTLQVEAERAINDYSDSSGNRSGASGPVGTMDISTRHAANVCS